jgi:hypothetical protein
MQCLQVKPIVCLDRHKAHVLTIDGFRDGLGVQEVVLVGSGGFGVFPSPYRSDANMSWARELYRIRSPMSR